MANIAILLTYYVLPSENQKLDRRDKSKMVALQNAWKKYTAPGGEGGTRAHFCAYTARYAGRKHNSFIQFVFVFVSGKNISWKEIGFRFSRVDHEEISVLFRICTATDCEKRYLTI